MLATWIKRILGIFAIVAVVGVIVYALMPAPVGVDIAVIGRGPLEVTVDEEGVAEIRDVFRVSAPIAGKLNRIPVHVGDVVSPEGRRSPPSSRRSRRCSTCAPSASCRRRPERRGRRWVWRRRR